MPRRSAILTSLIPATRQRIICGILMFLVAVAIGPQLDAELGTALAFCFAALIAFATSSFECESQAGYSTEAQSRRCEPSEQTTQRFSANVLELDAMIHPTWELKHFTSEPNFCQVE